MRPSHLILPWPPWALLAEALKWAKSFPYIKIIWALKNLHTPGCFPNFPNLNLAMNLYFLILPRFGGHCIGELSVPLLLIFLWHHLLAYLPPSTFMHILWSECLPNVIKAVGNVRLCQLKSIFAREAFWHICVTSKCLSKLLKKLNLNQWAIFKYSLDFYITLAFLLTHFPHYFSSVCVVAYLFLKNCF